MRDLSNQVDYPMPVSVWIYPLLLLEGQPPFYESSCAHFTFVSPERVGYLPGVTWTHKNMSN